MALWNQAFYNQSGFVWGPLPVPPTTRTHHPRKKSNMKRQPYFPRLIGLREAWFTNYATQLPLANATLALPATAVTESVADARYCEYVCGKWLTAVRDFSPAATSSVEDLLNGPEASFVLPVFTAPDPAGWSHGGRCRSTPAHLRLCAVHQVRPGLHRGHWPATWHRGPGR